MSAAAAAIAASQAAALQQMEEEQMTPYSPSDLAEQWEFKIIRSATGKFRDPTFLAQTLAEEARWGWTLLEKFDNNRVRLKRPTSARGHDTGRTSDPYRITVGPGQGAVFAVVLAVTLGLAAFVAAVAIYFSSPHGH